MYYQENAMGGRIENIIFDGNQRAWGAARGIWIAGGERTTISNCTVQNVSHSGLTVLGRHVGLVVRDCTFKDISWPEMDRRRNLKWYRVFNSIAVLGTFLLLRAIMGSAQGAEKLQPLLYDLRADEMSDEGVPVIKPWKTITLDPQYNGMWVIAGELDGDGSVLWKWGDSSIGRTRLHHDVACQIYDCDSDGKNEVIVAAGDRAIYDGSTGKKLAIFDIQRSGICLQVDMTNDGVLDLIFCDGKTLKI